jgi:hypothetical protein
MCLCYSVARSCCGPLRVICLLGLGLSKPNSFSGRLYKEASRLGFREFSCLVRNYRVLHCVSFFQENGADVLSNIDRSEGSCIIKDYRAVV